MSRSGTAPTQRSSMRRNWQGQRWSRCGKCHLHSRQLHLQKPLQKRCLMALQQQEMLPLLRLGRAMQLAQANRPSPSLPPSQATARASGLKPHPRRSGRADNSLNRGRPHRESPCYRAHAALAAAQMSARHKRLLRALGMCPWLPRPDCRPLLCQQTARQRCSRLLAQGSVVLTPKRGGAVAGGMK